MGLPVVNLPYVLQEACKISLPSMGNSNSEKAAVLVDLGVCQHLAGAGKKSKTQERLEMLRREKEDAETSECTFQPQINSRSDRLMTERTETLKNLNVTAHQQLFQDAIRRQHK